MAFWGIELQPGKPYTQFFDKALGKLHIFKANLGVTTTEHVSRTVVQCKIGSNNPIILCSFRQFTKESCSIDIDFVEDVVFEVIGTASVHLAGSYLGNGHNTEE
ncbi:hypothetical protein MKW94_019811 [Papaver nudicaule]|uniref:Nucleoplasmin-like domain-containing protein n=1 Tax=Papaver nudicaule TaxID=74823 RepID=A0AA41VR38_PAPNU|nr:hypothetical protein [Papaver nudicaule]